MNEYFIYQQRYNTVKTVNYSYIKLVDANEEVQHREQNEHAQKTFIE